MPGNVKSKRISEGAKAKRATFRVVSSPVVNFVNPSEELAKLHLIAIKSLNRIIDQTGNFIDWMNVLHRLYIGAVATEKHFKTNQDITDAFNNAHRAIVIIKLRTLKTGTFGILVGELDNVTLALTLTDQACRMMTLREITAVHRTVEEYFEEMHKQNRKAYPTDFKEKEVDLTTPTTSFNEWCEVCFA